MIKKLIALLATITAGASFAGASVIIPEPTLQLEKSARALDDYNITVPVDGNFFAGDYTFDFYIEDLSTVADGTVLAGYTGTLGGTTGHGHEQGSNAFVFVKEGDNLKLKVGRGSLSSMTIDGSTAFTFSDNKTFNVILKAGVLYTIKVTGRTQNQTVSIWADDTKLAEVSYNGNMNGQVTGQMNTGFNQAFNPGLAIPEPSAFGLLAGLGALALVAARRRRSRSKV